MQHKIVVEKPEANTLSKRCIQSWNNIKMDIEKMYVN